MLVILLRILRSSRSRPILLILYWYPEQESNPHPVVRSHMFYPLDYRGISERTNHFIEFSLGFFVVVISIYYSPLFRSYGEWGV